MSLHTRTPWNTLLKSVSCGLDSPGNSTDSVTVVRIGTHHDIRHTEVFYHPKDFLQLKMTEVCSDKISFLMVSRYRCFGVPIRRKKIKWKRKIEVELRKVDRR
jgi:hypothetical protein